MNTNMHDKYTIFFHFSQARNPHKKTGERSVMHLRPFEITVCSARFDYLNDIAQFPFFLNSHISVPSIIYLSLLAAMPARSTYSK